MMDRKSFKTNHSIFQEIECDECGKLLVRGMGDLNCIDFLCPECFNKLKKEVENPKKTLWDNYQDNPNLLDIRDDFHMERVFKEEDVKEALKEIEKQVMQSARDCAPNEVPNVKGIIQDIAGEEFFEDE